MSNEIKGAAIRNRAAEDLERMRQALERIAKPEAFHVATSDVDPESMARKVYAEKVLAGHGLQDAELAAELAAMRCAN